MQITKLLRFATALIVVAVVSGSAVSRASAAPVELHVVDVLGARVDLAAPVLTPTVLIFMSRSAKDASAAFARAIDERLLDRAINSVGIVDVRKYAGIVRSIATSYLRRSAEDAKVKRRERRQARGVDASPAACDRWHLIGDFDGSLFSRFGVEREPKQPLAFVVDSSGQLHGPFHDVETVVSAVTAQR